MSIGRCGAILLTIITLGCRGLTQVPAPEATEVLAPDSPRRETPTPAPLVYVPPTANPEWEPDLAVTVAQPRQRILDGIAEFAEEKEFLELDRREGDLIVLSFGRDRPNLFVDGGTLADPSTGQTQDYVSWLMVNGQFKLAGELTIRAYDSGPGATSLTLDCEYRCSATDPRREGPASWTFGSAAVLCGTPVPGYGKLTPRFRAEFAILGQLKDIVIEANIGKPLSPEVVLVDLTVQVESYFRQGVLADLKVSDVPECWIGDEFYLMTYASKKSCLRLVERFLRASGHTFDRILLKENSWGRTIGTWEGGEIQ